MHNFDSLNINNLWSYLLFNIYYFTFLDFLLLFIFSVNFNASLNITLKNKKVNLFSSTNRSLFFTFFSQILFQNFRLLIRFIPDVQKNLMTRKIRCYQLIWLSYSKTRSSWITCLKHDRCLSLACSSRLRGTSTNWVEEDVMVMHVQGVLSMAAWQISRSCLSKTCCPWLHVRSKSLLHAFILDMCLPFHIRSVRRCMTVY